MRARSAIGWTSLWLAAVVGFVATAWKIREMLGKPASLVPYRTIWGNEVHPMAVLVLVALASLTLALGVPWRFFGPRGSGPRPARRRRSGS
jgi:hypothetical protein